MGKQYNKVQKRRRRATYVKRKRTTAGARKGKAAPVPESAAPGTPAGYTAAEPKTA